MLTKMVLPHLGSYTRRPCSGLQSMVAGIRFNTDSGLGIIAVMSVVDHPHTDAGHQEERDQEDRGKQLANRLAGSLVFGDEEFEF